MTHAPYRSFSLNSPIVSTAPSSNERVASVSARGWTVRLGLCRRAHQERPESSFPRREPHELLVDRIRGQQEAGDAALDVFEGRPADAPDAHADEPRLAQLASELAPCQQDLVLGLALGRIEGRTWVAIQEHRWTVRVRVEGEEAAARTKDAPRLAHGSDPVRAAGDVVQD